MALHQILSNNPDILKKLEQIAGSDDAVLLCGDGVYQCARLKTDLVAYALTQDLTVRGLGSPEHVTSIDDEAWADLVINHGPTVSWT
ncbi:MAG: DsrH/TusB family sulfur metabolism protein [Thalassolituus sp.]